MTIRIVHQPRTQDALPAAIRPVPRPVRGIEFFGEYQGSGYDRAALSRAGPR